MPSVCDVRWDVNKADYSVLSQTNLFPSDGFYILFDVKSKFRNAIYPPPSPSQDSYEFSEEASFTHYSPRDLFKATEDTVLRAFLKNRDIPRGMVDGILQQLERFSVSMANDPCYVAPKLLPLRVDISMSVCLWYGYDYDADDDDDDDDDDDVDDDDDDILDQYNDVMQEENTIIGGGSPAAEELIRVDELFLKEKRFEAIAHQNNSSCTVCLEEFSEGEKVISLACKHVYHGECIRRWLKNRDVCPLCRFKIPLIN